MKELIAVGACASAPAERLLREALRRRLAVTQLTDAAASAIGADELPPGVRCEAITIDAGAVADWCRRHRPDATAALLALDAPSGQVAAAAAALLGWPGPRASGVLHAGSKRAWKAALRDQAIAVPRGVFVKADAFAHAHHEAAGLQPPLVMKADRSLLPVPVRCCEQVEALPEQLAHLWDEAGASPVPAEGVLVEEHLDGPVYSVALFDGACVGVLQHVRPAAHDFFERAITTDVDLADAPLLQLVDTARRAVTVLDLRWGPVTVDCVVHRGTPQVIDVDTGLYGHFTCQLLRDGYGFDQAHALLDKLQGRDVALPAAPLRPRCYARVDFLLDGDPAPWDIRQRGEVDTDEVFLSYGPRPLHERDRRAYVYFRSKAAPAPRSTEAARPLWWIA